MERFENRSGVRELGSFNNCASKRVLDVLKQLLLGEIVIYSLFNIFIPAVNRPIVLTFVGLLPGRYGSL